MKKLIVVAVMLMLAGCTTPQMKEESYQAEKHYMESIKNGSVDCVDKAMCDKAFQLTKVYINNNSDMRVQQSDDTTISTFGPIHEGYVAMSATKTPGKGDSSTITIAVDCRGIDRELQPIEFSRSFNPACLRKVSKIYDGFQPYIESRLK